MNDYLEKPRKKYNELMAEPELIDHILFEGAKKARAMAAPILEKVKTKIGRYR